MSKDGCYQDGRKGQIKVCANELTAALGKQPLPIATLAQDQIHLTAVQHEAVDKVLNETIHPHDKWAAENVKDLCK